MSRSPIRFSAERVRTGGRRLSATLRALEDQRPGGARSRHGAHSRFLETRAAGVRVRFIALHGRIQRPIAVSRGGGGDEIHLTPAEFDLLRVLGVNVGRVLTHRQLLERVWGSYAAENSQQLRVCINYLRRKLEDDPSHPRWIVTEPGVGYRLRSDVCPEPRGPRHVKDRASPVGQN